MPQQVSDGRVLLSTLEAMQKSNISREHIQRLLRTGKLEGTKPGHDWFVYEDSLKAFLAQPRKPGRKALAKEDLQNYIADSDTAKTNQKE